MGFARFLFVLLIATLVVPQAVAVDFPSRREIQAAAPGQVLRVEPLPGAAFGNDRAYRVIYRSTDFKGDAAAFSGAFFIPNARAPRTGRNIVAWAHATTGVANHCAPSLKPGNASSIPALEDMLSRGWAVVAPDYEGLGVPGIHPYLSGTSAARSIADSVRAMTRLLHGTGSGKYAVWGHSQGGHAALFAGQLASRIVPELKLVGVAAAAPPTDLAALLRSNLARSTGTDIEAMTIWSWGRAYGLPVSDIVQDGAHDRVSKVATDCIESVSDYLQLLIDEKWLGSFLKFDPVHDRRWLRIMQENSPNPDKIDVPVFIAQDRDDNIVPIDLTRRFVDRMCEDRKKVRFVELDRSSHIRVAENSAASTISWIADRFSGLPPPSDCRVRR